MAYDALVIGAGQAGLATSYYLRQQGAHFLLLEAAGAVGYAWHCRYDSLTLYTPGKYSSLPGLPFPWGQSERPHRAQIIAYFEQYRQHFGLPVRFHQRVISLTKHADGFEVQTVHSGGEETRYRARNVVVCTGSAQQPYIPVFSGEADSSVRQLHSSEYRNPSALPTGKVLVAGAGDSAAQIAVEVAATVREVYLSVNKRLQFKPLSLLGKSVFWWGEVTGYFRVPARSWLGGVLQKQDVGVYNDDLQQLLRRGTVRLVPQISHLAGKEVQFSDGQAEAFDAIIWATGYRRNYRWIQIPGSLANEETPVHCSGVSPVEGLYFVGLPWQRTATSALIFGAARDAAFVVQHLAERNGW